MIDTADTRLKLVNQKLTEVELQQLDVEVRFTICRQLMFWMIRISLLKEFKQKWKRRIGEMSQTKRKINTNSIGERDKISKRTKNSKQCGKSLEEIKSQPRKMLMLMSMSTQPKIHPNRKEKWLQHDHSLIYVKSTIFVKFNEKLQIIQIK